MFKRPGPARNATGGGLRQRSPPAGPVRIAPAASGGNFTATIRDARAAAEANLQEASPEQPSQQQSLQQEQVGVVGGVRASSQQRQQQQQHDDVQVVVGKFRLGAVLPASADDSANEGESIDDTTFN